MRPGVDQILQRKGCGRLIHISDFIFESTGRLVVLNEDGSVKHEACKIIYPGSGGDPYWDKNQFLAQVKNAAIPVFEEANPGKQALFIFDQSSAHAALPDNALRAFEMNKSNGGAQRTQRDTIIPVTNKYPEYCMKPQSMTTLDANGKRVPKGLQQVLEERGFNVTHMRAKCQPVCPFENYDCCMARLLSHQDDFANQTSELEQVIIDAGHLCLFLPKFHCELNPIEMVCSLFLSFHSLCSITYLTGSTGAGPNTVTDKFRRQHLNRQRQLQSSAWMHALWMLFADSSIVLGGLQQHIRGD
jgi:hypothetical protein